MIFGQTLTLILVTLLPVLELRFSIPLGILTNTVHLPFGLTLHGFGLPWLYVFFICVLTNAILGPLVYLFLDKFIHHFFRFKWFERYYEKKVEKTQRKIRPYVRKYGLLGISIFVGMPIPGSGSWTGALGAYLLGIKFRRFVVANIIGVFIAGTLVTLASLGILNLF